MSSFSRSLFPGYSMRASEELVPQLCFKSMDETGLVGAGVVCHCRTPNLLCSRWTENRFQFVEVSSHWSAALRVLKCSAQALSSIVKSKVPESSRKLPRRASVEPDFVPRFWLSTCGQELLVHPRFPAPSPERGKCSPREEHLKRSPVVALLDVMRNFWVNPSRYLKDALGAHNKTIYSLPGSSRDKPNRSIAVEFGLSPE